MELAAQPICLVPICMNTYFFRVGSCYIYKLGMLTGQRFQAELSPSFLWKFTEFRAETHPPCLWNSKLCYPSTSSEFQSKKPPLSKMPPVVWYGYFLESPIRRLIISTEQTSIYVSPFPNNLTSKKARNQEISIYFTTNSIADLCHAPS